jgi:hypothetical protein
MRLDQPVVPPIKVDRSSSYGCLLHVTESRGPLADNEPVTRSAYGGLRICSLCTIRVVYIGDSKYFYRQESRIT